ncbi:RING-H2 finger protein ATL28 [Hordeum vulgare]|nr:RING-H2 finger protein ATL28 [Hordeum vulgare]
MMFGSGMNLLSAALGFGMTAVFVAFVCARFICCRARGAGDGAPPPVDFDVDFPADLERPVRAIPPTTYGSSVSTPIFCCCELHAVYKKGTSNATVRYITDDEVEDAHCGLEPLVIAAIPIMKYSEELYSKDDAQCSICLSEYTEKELLRIIPTCRHNFHRSCLDLWLQKQTTCPICRVSLKELPSRKAAITPSCSNPQVCPRTENSVNPAPDWLLPVHHSHRGQQNGLDTQGSVEVIIEHPNWIGIVCHLVAGNV